MFGPKAVVTIKIVFFFFLLQIIEVTYKRLGLLVVCEMLQSWNN